MQTSESSTSASLLVGVLVGGAARRMGGQPKGLLPVPGGGERIVPRLLRLTKEAFPHAAHVLVGEHPAYVELGLPMLPDAASNAGPLAGLVSLLRAADAQGRASVILLAGDLPLVSLELLVRLGATSPDARAVVPRLDDRYQPLFARYSALVRPLAEAALRGPDRSLQALVRRLSPAPFPLTPAEEALLVDWDEPADLLRPPY